MTDEYEFSIGRSEPFAPGLKRVEFTVAKGSPDDLGMKAKLLTGEPVEIGLTGVSREVDMEASAFVVVGRTVEGLAVRYVLKQATN